MYRIRITDLFGVSSYLPATYSDRALARSIVRNMLFGSIPGWYAGGRFSIASARVVPA